MKIPLFPILLIFIPLVILISFQAKCQNVFTKTITVEPYLAVQNYEHYRRFVLNTSIPEIEFIDGFDFDWGYTYRLKVSVTELKPELSDGTRFKVALLNVISKTKVPDSTEFRLFIHPDLYYYQLPPEEELQNTALMKLDDSTYLYFSGVEIEVPENLRNQFHEFTIGHIGKLGEFRFVNSKRIKLVGI